jgi:PAT family beta-lactamase induction signal transducer AmpG
MQSKLKLQRKNKRHSKLDMQTSQKKDRLRSLWTASLYYAQGLPFSIVRQMSVVFFKDQGVSLQSLGHVALYGLPWTLKFLWAPIVDTFLTRKRWVILMEMLLIASFALLATVAQLAGHINPFGFSTVQIAAYVFLLIAVYSATHDIAIDAFYLEALDKSEQAKFSGWIVASYRLAMLTGSGILISIAGKFGWGAAFGAACIIFICLLIWHSIYLPQLKPTNLERRPRGHELKKMAEGFKTFFKLPGIYQAIAFIIFFKLGDALLFGMSTPFLLDAGMTKTQLGFVVGVVGTIAAISASIFGGWFISKYKLRRGLWIFGIIQNLTIPVYAIIASVKGPFWTLVVGVIVEQIAAGLGTAAYANFVMRQNDPNYKATHYAVATGLMSLTTMMGGELSGRGAQHFGYATFFTLAFFASIPGLALIPFIARRPECQ